MDIITLIFLSVITYIIYKIFINPDKFVNEFTFEPKKSSKYFGNYNEDEIVYVTEPNKEKPIKIAKEGLGSIPAKTFLSVMKDAINNHGNKVFMKKEYKDNNSEFKWNEWTLNEFHDDGMTAGRALIKLGLQQWKTVGFIGFNSPQWYIAQLGTMYAGGLVAGIYTTNNPGQCKYIAEHSKMQIVLVENKKQLDKFVKIKDELNDLKAIVIWDKSVTKDDELIIELNKKGNTKILTWNEFMDMGVSNDEMNDEIKKRQDIIKPGHCCLLIYTSGTTGPPKAVMISHDSLVWTASGIWNQVKTIKRTGEHSMVSYLPLSHVAAQLADFFFPLISLANHKKLDKFVVHFARNDALKGSLALTLKYARPTIFFGVPRVWEKFYEAIMKKRKQNPPGFVMSNIISILKNIGLQSFNNKQLTGNMVKPFGYILFEKLLRAKVLKGLGFDRLQAGVCGAAPPQRSTLNFFGSMGIHIIEVYGMSESTGLICSTLPYNYIIGSVGVLFEGCEVYLDHIDGRDKVGHGEICIRGRLVMNGYMYNDNKTANTIDKQGWLHSGDIGTFTKINKNGIEYEILSITGRIKELIVTAGGENVAPVPIENYIKNILKGISNIIIIGDQKKYLTCLITLKCKQDLDTLKYSNELDSDALTIDTNCTTVDDAKKSKVWNDYINAGIKTYNNDKNVCVSNAQKIQYFSVLHGDFSVATGEMTDTMKLKRAIIYKNYLDVIESMYNKTKK